MADRIAALSDQIQAQPGDPRLYLKRGELHRVHRDWEAALQDYQQAARLAPGRLEIDFLQGRMWHEANRPGLARMALDRFLAQRPHHPGARLTRSRVLARLGQPLHAANDLEVTMQHLERLTPELYLEHARLFVAAGGPHIEKGLQRLDQGIATLGPVVALVQVAIEIETRLARYEAALRRMAVLPQVIAQQPAWLKRRADLLRAAGRPHDAQAVYQQAMSVLAAQPSGRRATSRSRDLEAALRRQLATWTPSTVDVDLPEDAITRARATPAE